MSITQLNNWIDRQTRAVIVEFSIFNPNINLVGVAEIIVEFLPRSQLFSFANELRDLAKGVESLQISLLNNKFLTCQKAYCRWKHIGKYKNQGKRHPQSPLTHHNDLASFRTKVFRVESLEFKLQTILDCEYDPSYLERYSEEALKIRLLIFFTLF